MSWYPCLCGHRIDEHFLTGNQRHGPCKAKQCSCASFQATNKPPSKP